MTLNELDMQLDKALRAYIKKRKHILTGAMYDSVAFECSDSGKLKVKLSAKYYIKFLEHGEFLSDFIHLPTTIDILKQYEIDKLYFILNEIK